MVADVRDPRSPAAGETPTWTGRWALHHAVVQDNIAYGSWRNGGLTILDVKDPANMSLIAHRNWCPPYGGAPTAPSRCTTGSSGMRRHSTSTRSR
jgi:hypothetical protein